jgi:hypothetical protein
VTRIARTVGACVLVLLVAVLVDDGGRWLALLSGERRYDPHVSGRSIEQSPRGDQVIGAATTGGRLVPRAVSVRKGPAAFSLRATARGLFPGAKKPLRVKISNRSRFAIKITSIRVRVKRDRTHVSCPPKKYVRTTRFPRSIGRRAGRRVSRPIRVRPRRSRRVKLAITLLYSAPDACQGAAFPLRLRGKAVKA